jgi:hypothetical protein
MDTRETTKGNAVALGRGWAEKRAEALRGRVPAEQWPETWDDADNGPLPTNTDEADRLRLCIGASYAAHARWRELLDQQRSVEPIESAEPPGPVAV